MIHGVKINDVDSLETYGLMLLSNITISAPALKLNRIDIPWADGSLDYSYFTGQPAYDDRKIKFTLFARIPDQELIEIRSKLMSDYHGKIVNLILPDDTTMYYRGTIEFGDVSGYNSGKILVTMLADPWKYAVQETVVTQRGNGTVKLSNLRMPVTPKIKCTASAKFTWDGNSVSLSSGDNQIISGLTLGAGETSVTVETTGTVTFTYRQGGF